MADEATRAPASSTSGARKRMRKGTQSCAECRRRKTRCNIQPGDSTCTPCVSRGSRCLDQQDGKPFVVEHDITPVRDRWAWTQVRVATRDTPSRWSRAESQQLTEQSDLSNPGDGADRRAPFVSALDDAEMIRPDPLNAEGSIHLQREAQNMGVEKTHRLQALEGKARSVCETLRATLPSYDAIISHLRQHGAWWSSFRQKTHVISQAPIESVTAFAARTYTSSNPAELGILAAAYARSSGNRGLYTLVDTLVVSDFTYSATIEGMECLILLAKCYTDHGQPRRAWFMWQRGIAIAKLMGLYRPSPDFPAGQMIWWAVYHGDRFTSLLLGLPYSFSDGHFGPDAIEESEPGPQRFVLQCAFMAGKVVDRNVAPGRPSFAKAMDLAEQMDEITATMPKKWWELPAELPGSIQQLDELRDKLLMQYFFFHVKMYIHLPFLAKSTLPTMSLYAISRHACMDASRHLLRRFGMLSGETQKSALFECKTSDFVGFMAAVVLLVGLSDSTEQPSQIALSEDMRLISATEGIFARQAREKGCKISAQCRKTLVMLSEPWTDDRAHGSLGEQEIAIPYFGTVVRRRAKASAPWDDGPVQPPAPPTHLETLSRTTVPAGCPNLLSQEQTIEYTGYELPDFLLGRWQPTEDLSMWLDDAAILF